MIATSTNAPGNPVVTGSASWSSSCLRNGRPSTCVLYSQTAPAPTDQAPDVKAIGPYSAAALRRAVLERLEDGVWYAEVEELPGVWAEGPDPASCIDALRAVIEEWIVLKLRDGDSDFPRLDGIDLNQL